jgi:hypothetical protein
LALCSFIDKLFTSLRKRRQSFVIHFYFGLVFFHFPFLAPISIDEWVNHYKSLLQMNGEQFDKLAETETQFHNDTPLDFPFTCKEVKTCISSLKLNKKEGIDLILNEFIKYGSSILLTTLVKLL